MPLDEDAAGDAEAEAEAVTELGGDEPEATLTVQDLEKMDIDDLVEVAQQAGIKAKKYKGMKKKALRELIIAETNLPPF
jgi:hypothetical protein